MRRPRPPAGAAAPSAAPGAARRLGGVVALALAVAAVARAEEGWTTVVTGPVTVKNRSIPGSPIKEVWAEGAIDAPLIDVQDALMNVSRLKSFMPYMKDARIIGEHPADQSVFIYTLIDLPVVGKRDYVTQLWQPQAVKPDGTGTFEARWEARPTHTPERAGVIRLKKNDGSWLATARDDGKTWLVHRFAVDPGGWVPAFAANLGNQQGVTDTYRNVEREAQKRTRERLASPGAAQTKPAPQVLPAVADMTPPPPGPPAGAEAKPAAGASSPAAGPGAP